MNVGLGIYPSCINHLPRLLMVKKFLISPILVFLAYGLFSSSDFATIASGISIFIVGMFFMEDGFKLFTGGTLTKILKKTTGTVFKAIVSGFVATAVVQSSSLISVVAISFLTAELMTLSQAVGIIFGANIGTTATAWIVSALGMKIKIAAYGMPMLVFGVLFTFFENKTYKGIGNVLLGLGFIFLGISFMKDGFENLKNGIDLGQFSVEGITGIIVYIVVGALATIIIQSSSATMALIITAVATGQIDYMNSLSLAIGANLGTTVTAALGAVTSNANGKRLAVAHFIFNIITALFAVLFMKVLMTLVDFLSGYLGIGDQDIGMKLALFHTLFNFAGVILITPFTGILVKFLKTLFIYKNEKREKPRFLDEHVILTPGPAIAALYKETEYLFDCVSDVIIHALNVTVDPKSTKPQIKETLSKGQKIDINLLYEKRIKFIYSDILKYSILAESHMNKTQRNKVYQIKLASRDLVEAVKDIRELQKNCLGYMDSKNRHIIKEYNFLKNGLVKVLRTITELRSTPYHEEKTVKVEEEMEKNSGLDIVAVKRLSVLLRKEKINDMMASSLMNDGTYTSTIAENLLKSGLVLWGTHENSGPVGKVLS